MGSKVKKIFKNIMIIILLLLIILSNFKNYVFAFSGEELIKKNLEQNMLGEQDMVMQVTQVKIHLIVVVLFHG